MWNVEYTDEFEEWWETLNEDEQDAVDRSVGLLEDKGPALQFRCKTIQTRRNEGIAKPMQG
jgi:hypothetical protein